MSLKPERDEKLFTALNLNKKIDQHFINILDYKKLANLIKIKKPDIIFHLAAKSLVSDGYHQPIETFKTNIIGSANVLNHYLEATNIFHWYMLHQTNAT